MKVPYTPLKWWRRVESVTEREDGKLIMHLSCEHDRLCDPIPTSKADPSKLIGDRVPCRICATDEEPPKSAA